MSDKERFVVYFALRVIEIKSGSVQPSDKFIVSSLLSIGIRAVERIWGEAKKQIVLGQEVYVSSKKKQRCGRKRKDMDLSRTATIPLNKRRTIRALARYGSIILDLYVTDIFE